VLKGRQFGLTGVETWTCRLKEVVERKPIWHQWGPIEGFWVVRWAGAPNLTRHHLTLLFFSTKRRQWKAMLIHHKSTRQERMSSDFKSSRNLNSKIKHSARLQVSSVQIQAGSTTNTESDPPQRTKKHPHFMRRIWAHEISFFRSQS
jgi:hypothetical protein